MQKSDLLQYLTHKPQQDPEKLAVFDARLKKAIASIFMPVHQNIRQRRYEEFWLKGGRGSCKSSFASCEILYELYHDTKASALVLRKVAASLRDSVYAQMIWAIDTLGVSEDWDATVSPMELTNKHTGQKIMFRGLDEPRKIKSIRPKRGYFGIVWFEELEEYGGIAEIRSVMQSVGRGKGAKTVALMSYNPPKAASNWVNKEALVPMVERMVHHSTYLDVPQAWLGEGFLAKANALKERNELAWRHEYAGEAIGGGGAVFANLKIRAITKDELGYCQANPMYGLDFGYSTDPCALMSEAYAEAPDGKKTLYIFDEWYKAGAGFDAIEKACKRQCGSHRIWCDTEPRTIAEVASRGLQVAAARKGPKSRLFGMQWLEDLDEIIVDPNQCPEAAREFASFEHARNRDGSWRADYQDGNDHTIDASRYGAWPIIYQNKRTKYFSGKGGRK